MASLYFKVKIYLENNSKNADELFSSGNIWLRDDSQGEGEYIHIWNVSGLAEPTDEQLSDVESDADKIEKLAEVLSTRKAEYPTTQECVHAILDDDLAALQAKRAKVKTDNPKPTE